MQSYTTRPSEIMTDFTKHANEYDSKQSEADTTEEPGMMIISV